MIRTVVFQSTEHTLKYRRFSLKPLRLLRSMLPIAEHTRENFVVSCATIWWVPNVDTAAAENPNYS